MLYDKDIREPLFDYLEEHYGKVRILQEKRTGKSRADVIMVTEHGIYGLEIKSDADTYTRLESQVADYDKYFDYNFVVAGSKHGQHVEEHVPPHWGIITVEEIEEDKNVDFYLLRDAKPNPNLDIYEKITILWRPEVAHIQEVNGLYKYEGKSKRYVMDYVIEALPEEVLWPQVYEALFERDYTAIRDQINAYRVQHGQKARRRKKYRRRKVGQRRRKG
jgi:hypothetical protein